MPLLVFCHKIDPIGLGQRFQVLLFRPGTNQGAVLGLRLQPPNFGYIFRGCVAEPHGIEITCYLEKMNDAGGELLPALEDIVLTVRDRQKALAGAAALIRSSANYRWIGLYDVDHAGGLVRNIIWSGPGGPEHPTFPLTKGLTSAAIAQKQIVNVGDVTVDPRYLTAFGTTRSEIIVPVFDADGKSVVGTIDVESETTECLQ